MKVHRFYVDNILLKTDSLVLEIQDQTLLHQWFNVLRLKKYEKVILFSEEVLDTVFEIVEISKKLARLRVTNKNTNIIKDKVSKKSINPQSLFLHFPIIKKDNLYFLLEKSIEIGVCNFCPTVSDRTENKNLESFKKDIEKNRINLLFKESIEQSYKYKMPLISSISKAVESINSLLHNKQNIILVTSFEGLSLKDFIDDKSLSAFKDINIHVFVGPEGGWTEREIQEFNNFKIINKDNFYVVSLINSVLRSETACIYSVSCFL